jgi:hypothetical protein
VTPRAKIACAQALLLLLLAAGAPAAAQTTSRVLLVGNSYANGADNHLPGFFNAKAGGSLSLRSYTPGGVQLRKHLGNPALLEDIRTGRYDVVVLQEQSQTPGLAWLAYGRAATTNDFAGFARARVEADPGAPADLAAIFWTGARGLSAHVLTTSTARVLYFSHWARHPDDASFLPSFPGADGAARAAAMLDANNRTFAGLAQVMGDRTAVAPVGDTWALSYRERPGLRLHAGDNSHGSSAGYYLAAAVLYECITGRSSVGNDYTGGLPPADALHLQHMATRATGAAR